MLVVHFCVVCVSIYQSIKDSIDQFKPILLPKYIWVKILAQYEPKVFKIRICLLSALVRTSHIFIFFSKSFGQFQPNLAQSKPLCVNGIQVFANKGQAHMLEDIIDQLQKFAECLLKSSSQEPLGQKSQNLWLKHH